MPSPVENAQGTIDRVQTPDVTLTGANLDNLMQYLNMETVYIKTPPDGRLVLFVESSPIKIKLIQAIQAAIAEGNKSKT